ncbi:hypothetical protein V3C41_01945 [Paenarthrobacter nicotinovorans]|uniref:Uncharacterized protein n=1 Tax=Paenarthrobacter nicotinovorans TaxID=29320 RepID=A0ABV0GMR4_PAENI
MTVSPTSVAAGERLFAHSPERLGTGQHMALDNTFGALGGL